MKELNLSKEAIDYYLNFRIDVFDKIYTTDIILKNKEGGYKNIYDDNNELILSIKINGNYFNLCRYEKINGFRTKKSITEVDYIAFSSQANITDKRYDENDNIIEIHREGDEYYAEYKNNELFYEAQRSSVMLFTTLDDDINKPNGLFIKLFPSGEIKSPYNGKMGLGPNSFYISFNIENDDLNLVFDDIVLNLCRRVYNYNEKFKYSIIAFTVKNLSYTNIHYCYLREFDHNELCNYTNSNEFLNLIKELYNQNKE